MKKQIQISVPSPCHEQWGSFRPTSNGGFCGSCQKEVIDFSTWDDDRLRTYLKTERNNVCGRFKESQLKVYTYDKPQALSLKWIGLLFTTAFLIFSKPASAQRQKGMTITEQELLTLVEKEDTVVSVMKVSGVVKDETGLAMPGANVIRKGTAQGVMTDAEGRFELEISKPAPREVLVVSFVGYIDTEVCVGAHYQQKISANMLPDLAQFGCTIRMGAVRYNRISPRRWWGNFKNLFR